MGRRLALEDFGGSQRRRAGEVAVEALPEEQRLAVFEDGYRAGGGGSEPAGDRDRHHQHQRGRDGRRDGDGPRPAPGGDAAGLAGDDGIEQLPALRGRPLVRQRLVVGPGA